MRSFTCTSCGQLVYFENTECLRCHSPLGFEPERLEIIALRPDPADPTRFAPVGLPDLPRRYRRCANTFLARCNWLVADPVGSSGNGQGPAAGNGAAPSAGLSPAPGDDLSPTAGVGTLLCRCCELTRTRPNDDDPEAFAAFADTEAAKRRLVFQLLDLGLPVVPHDEEAGTGLAFDLMSSYDDESVTIGHAEGQITLDVAESDDSRRERIRRELGEPYRTMLGHLRHEIGHYYFPVLIGPGSGPGSGPGAGDRPASDPARLARARELFGDETTDYAAALERHYAEGPPADWPERHVSAYATMHPAEDWAETFAHYLHIRDTLQTAASFGIVITGPATEFVPGEDEDLVAVPALDIDDDPFRRILADWLPLTYALNAVNRSMGKPDLYPFVLGPAVIEKLAFAHEVVRAGQTAAT